MPDYPDIDSGSDQEDHPSNNPTPPSFDPFSGNAMLVNRMMGSAQRQNNKDPLFTQTGRRSKDAY